MSSKKIPGYEIVEVMIKEMDNNIKIAGVNDETMECKFCFIKNDKTCEVQFTRAFLDDLNDFTGSKTSKYWLALETQLKTRLAIALQLSEMIPFSSDIFFEDNQDWEKDNGQTTEVYFYNEDYEIFQDGLKTIYQYLEAQKNSISHLKLRNNPYNEDQEYVKSFIFQRNEEVTKYGRCAFRDGISLTSRRHLKAAVLVELLRGAHYCLHF